MSPRTVFLSLLAFAFAMRLGAQSGNSVSQIIAKISQLESARDPKCYATANRLEDFMYGTPLSDDARNLRIEVQKEVSLFIRNKASEIARKRGATTIARQDIVMVTDSIATVGTLKDGDYFFRLDTILLKIRKIDLDQYSSVAYGYRSMLAVEQDLIFLDEISQLPMEDEAVDVLYFFLNLSTLAALNVADMSAREENAHLISGSMMRDSWLRIFQKPKNQELLNFKYPQVKDLNGDNRVLNKVVQQKIESYDQYNQLSNSVFLRNIQVFFARQKWPVEQEKSDAMRSYLIESLVVFTREVIKYSEQFSSNRNEAIIRITDVQHALQLFLPFEVNDFEDVIFFPKDQENRITIEAYDLDAFRDGGIHWRILGYALDDPDVFKKVIDPTAAELIVEGVAQLGVLILRQAGIISHEAKSEVLTLHDLEAAFQQTQEIISNYASLPEVSERENKIQSQSGSAMELVFQDVTDEVGISFEHRSSDWLSRLIRSYVFSPDNNTAKLAIPPAFGGSGVAAEDINNDGFVDILLLGGIGNKLYINDQKGHFNEVSEGLPFDHFDSEKKSLGEVRQPIIADLNNDGFQDIIIIYVDDLHRVYKNLDGTHFADITDQVNLDGKEAVAGPATVLDYDNDGLLDLFIGYFGNYIQGQLPTLSRNNQNGMPNRLYRNLGDFKFEEVTFTLDSLTDNGWTQAAGHTDINQDGRQDLIVGNDFGVNRYYLNTPDRGFIEMSKVWKTDKPSYTMNVGIGDLNADQHPDLYISNIVVMQKEEKYV
ncbi:MAG: VCBS repeat-containing protein, partial [Saprospiraceae bacterium]|nr:VCBS repeat-containing protein [Saprospiraceae bacterium]